MKLNRCFGEGREINRSIGKLTVISADGAKFRGSAVVNFIEQILVNKQGKIRLTKEGIVIKNGKKIFEFTKKKNLYN